MTSSGFDADVIVAGGGPAGAATAAHLARMGIDVLVLERRRFPRDKVCGDFVGPVALVELHDLGVDRDDLLATWNCVDRAALFADGIELVTYALPQLAGLPAYGRVVPRVLLDAAIASAARRAGARIEEDIALDGFRGCADGIEVEARQGGCRRRLRARVLVGADGSGSTVARIVRDGTPRRDEFLVAVRAYYRGVAGPRERCDLCFTTASFPGYSWVFPTADGEANVGVGMVVATFPPAKEQMRGLLADLIARDPAMRARLIGARAVGQLEGWPLATYSGRTPVVSDRVLLVGDAAGLINPLNGEGIQWALCSGRWAAQAIVTFLRSAEPAPQTLLEYDARLRRELGRDMLLARFVVRAIANRTLNPLWLAILRGIATRARIDAPYALATGGVMAGIVPVREAFATGVLLSSASAVAGEITAACRNAGRLGARTAAAQMARAWAPATEMLLQPKAALDWVRDVAVAARDAAAGSG